MDSNISNDGIILSTDTSLLQSLVLDADTDILLHFNNERWLVLKEKIKKENELKTEAKELLEKIILEKRDDFIEGYLSCYHNKEELPSIPESFDFQLSDNFNFLNHLADKVNEIIKVNVNSHKKLIQLQEEYNEKNKKDL